MKFITMGCLIIAGAAVVFPGVSIADDCDQAQAQGLYQQSMELGKQAKWDDADSAAKKSTGVCNQFDNWYLLGQIQQERKLYQAAATAFIEARKYTKNDKQAAISIARYAESLASLGNTVQAASLMQQSRSFQKDAPDWVSDLAKGLDLKSLKKPITKSDITQALDERAYRSLNINASPSVNVRVLFKQGSVDFEDGVNVDLSLVADALAESQFDSKSFTIIGHTDTTGDTVYNDGLSVQRAESIYQKIIAYEPSLADKISVLGKGESQPLYKERDDVEKMLNRRIELRLD